MSNAYSNQMDREFPDILKCFINALIKYKDICCVYVPYALGDDVRFLQEKGVEVSFNQIYDNLKTNFSESLEAKHPNKKFDLIFSHLPCQTILPKSANVQVVEHCSSIIRECELAAFTFPKNITFAGGQKWLKSLERKGVYVNAILDLSSSLFKNTKIESRIVFLSSKQSDKVFISKSYRSEEMDSIIKNFLYENDDSNERLGKWIERSDFSSFPDYSTYENFIRKEHVIEEIARKFKCKPVELQNNCFRFESLKDGEIDDVLASVYIPRVGVSKVVTQVSDFEIRGNNYLRVIVDQNKLLPGFLAFILNSEEGVDLRLRSAKTSIMPFLNLETLKTMRLPIPSLEIQSKILEIECELDQIVQSTLVLSEQLRRTPLAYSTIWKQTKEINRRGDRFAEWIETLPYPVATILKRYHVTEECSEKQDILFYFFEAYAIFLATILVGAYGEFARAEKSVEDVSSGFFEKASFGSWVRLNRAIAKVIRQNLDSKDTIDKVVEGFGTGNRSVILALCSKKVCNILEEACNNRNAWKGHSGITGEPVYAEHVGILEKELMGIQSEILDVFEMVQLIRPVKLKCVNGEFINTVEVLSGSNSIFRKESIKCKALDETKLYIRMVDTNAVFELPPFLLMKTSSAKNACYFYNRMEGDNSRYVSYHFEERPEDIEQGDAAYAVIRKVLD